MRMERIARTARTSRFLRTSPFLRRSRVRRTSRGSRESRIQRTSRGSRNRASNAPREVRASKGRVSTHFASLAHLAHLTHLAIPRTSRYPAHFAFSRALRYSRASRYSLTSRLLALWSHLSVSASSVRAAHTRDRRGSRAGRWSAGRRVFGSASGFPTSSLSPPPTGHLLFTSDKRTCITPLVTAFIASRTRIADPKTHTVASLISVQIKRSEKVSAL